VAARYCRVDFQDRFRACRFPSIGFFFVSPGNMGENFSPPENRQRRQRSDIGPPP
jgi:hypothetical protein